MIVAIIKGFLLLVFCHLFGDFVLSSAYIQETKRDNPYHMLVHCLLYCTPYFFLISNGLTNISLLFISHLIIDSNTIKKRDTKPWLYTVDQVGHYLCAIVLYLPLACYKFI